MSQISYAILKELVGQRNHIRGLAKLLGTNQTTVARKVNEWEEKNVLDHTREGKNKTYFIKPSLEAQEYLKVLEHLRLVDALKKYAVLREIIKRIHEEPGVTLSILFGSYAKGTAERQSDIDIYLLTQDRTIKKGLELLNSKFSVKIGEFDKENLLIKEIIKNHVIIKGVDKYYELIR